MLYTEDFTMHHYVGFSQIGLHIEAPPPMDLVRVESNMSLKDDTRRQFCCRFKFLKIL